MAYGIILLPADPGPLTRLSAETARLADPIMHLGTDAPPHVSVVHADVPAETAMALWTELTARHRMDVALRFTGLMFAPIAPGDPYVPEGGVYCGLECARSAALLELHEAARSWLDAAQAPMLSPSGARFRPHLTLSVLRAAPSGVVPLPGPLFGADMRFRAALGRLGPYGTFPEIVATA
ncbi:2'-5' RNA ligase family protein [Actinomadura verrucosospora]|uniref:2'-5' RNA ligase n=1 Tax=Actinomadura verrucosospora TaxID=46165 RepID=A0A7D4APS6_ACTVE|nr:hypothetical protein [Actinomadura verrucosospora]QKG22029.1 hypothetical protein ACTIVE_3667 [Actinomadura verrucosospora]